MYYLFLALPLLVYFELLGRLFFLAIKKKPIEFNFIIGFCVLIAFLYVVGWPISIYGLPSIYYVILVCSFVFVTSVLMVININKINFKLNLKLWCLLIVFLLISIYVSFNRTLGDPHGFDSLFYINFIGYNVDTPSLNNVHPLFGSFPNTYYEKTITYAFQSYNYFVSSIIFVYKKIGSLFALHIETLPTYVWTFQIILSSFYIGSSIEAIKHINPKNNIFRVAIFILLVLFMGNFYYNNCFGFIGCNYRMPVHTMATIYLFDYLKNNQRKDLFVFFILMTSICGFSSTGTFSFVFILFALFFIVCDKESKLIKYYSIVLFFPVLNILFIKINTSITTILVCLFLFSLIYLLNDIILKIFRNRTIKISTIIIISILLIFVSIFFYTKNGNFVKGFIDNYSEMQDMSWDYFMFSDIRHIIFNTLVLMPMAFYLVINRKEKVAMMIIILIITIFNPLSANFINSINWVYYRSYDLIINQYTIAYFLFFILNRVNRKGLYSCLVLLLSSVLSIIQVPRYYHYQFVPDENYNPYYKIDNKELELIWNLQKLVEDNQIDEPKIASPTFYINTFINNSECLIGKEKTYNYADTNFNDYGLYTIIFPEDGWDNFLPEDIIYEYLKPYLENSKYNILIADYNKYITYYGEYISLSDAIERMGYKKTSYSTPNYAVFLLK